MSITAPDNRISTYEPVVATAEFAAGFPVFDNDDITVFVDGIERSDFAVSATYEEGIATDARAVFAVGLTGKVLVIGTREPRRTNRFIDGGPLPVRDQNLALDTLQSEMQEARRDISRAIKVAYGASEQGMPVPDGVSLLGWSPEGGLVNRPGEGASAAAAQAAAASVNIRQAATRAVLKTYSTLFTTLIFLQEPGREGLFKWTTGNFAAQVAVDAFEGVYVKATAVSASVGAWVRQGGWVVEGVNVKWFGVIGDYDTDDTAAFNAALDFHQAFGPGLRIPDYTNVGYSGSRKLPDGVVLNGAGAAKLDVWFPDKGDSLNVRPGYKRFISGSNIWFKGAATASRSTNRLDRPTISYGFYHQSDKPPRTNGVGFIIDFNIYDAAGALTGWATDGKANYDCAFLQQGPLGKFTDSMFRGFANFHCLVIYGQADQSVIDSDYNKFINCNIQGHAILTGDGSDINVSQGSTGTLFDGCDIYSTADHHKLADGQYTRRLFFLDGFIKGNSSPKGGIRGTTYQGCHFRTRANLTGQFGYCTDVFMVGCTSEFPTLTIDNVGVPNADAPGKFTNPNGRAKTLYFFGFAAGNSGGAGIQDLANSGADVVTLGGSFGNDITISRGGIFARMGIDAVSNAFFQMGQDATSMTDGWQFQLDFDQNDTLSVRYDGSEKWRVDRNGNAQFDGSVQTDGGIILPSYSVAQLLDGVTKPAAANPRCIVYVSNGASSKKVAVSDGTIWRYMDGIAV